MAYQAVRLCSALAAVFMTLVTSAAVAAESEGRPVGSTCVVSGSAAEVVVDAKTKVVDCLVVGQWVLVAVSPSTVQLWGLEPLGPALRDSHDFSPSEVVDLRVREGGAVVVLAEANLVEAGISADGRIISGPWSAGSVTPVKNPDAKAQDPGSSDTAGTGLGTPSGGRVVEVGNNTAVIDLGTRHGVTKGTRFEILRPREIERLNLETNVFMPMTELNRINVCEVIQVQETESLLRLGKGQTAEVGDQVRMTTDRVDVDVFKPPYPRNQHRASVRVAPFFGVETVNGGLMASVMWDYTFDFPMRIEAGLRNSVIMIGDNPVSPFAADLVLSFDTDLFEAGLGGGWMNSTKNGRSGAVFSQKIRLGTVDGFRLSVWNAFVFTQGTDDYYWWNFSDPENSEWIEGVPCARGDGFTKGDPDGFTWAGLEMELIAPLSEVVALGFRGGFLEGGFYHVQGGLRTSLGGNGGAGTWVMALDAGYVTVYDYLKSTSTTLECDLIKNKTYNAESFSYTEIEIGGPIVSLGVEYRF